MENDWIFSYYSVFSVVFTLADIHLNWLNWFCYLFFTVGPLVILIGGIFFLSPFLDFIRISMSTILFFPQQDSGALCKKNGFFLYTMTYTALSLELTDTFFFRFFLNSFSICFSSFSLLFLVTQCLVVSVHAYIEWIPI